MKHVLCAAMTLFMPWVFAAENLAERDDVRLFVQDMAVRHGFDQAELDRLFAQARISSTILEAIAKPAEKLPWYRYRRLFLQADRIDKGVQYWRANISALERMTATYGVPAEIVVAIIGVETRYGRNIGGYRVLDSLVTLGFGYPARGDFFRSELEQFLLLSREQKLDPAAVKGSYAGAMGIPQFIASSYRNYAVDFDGDTRVDIWGSDADAIGSVGSYFNRHGWLHGGLVTLPAAVGADPAAAIGAGLEPDLSVEDLARLGVKLPITVPADMKCKLLELEGMHAAEYWVGFWNFYVITRYNHSVLYAMAVYQLAQAIREEYQAAIAGR